MVKYIYVTFNVHIKIYLRYINAFSMHKVSKIYDFNNYIIGSFKL